MGKSFNLTDPENPSDVQHEAIESWDFKEAVTVELMRLGIPLRTAEVIAIDNKGVINVCYRSKASAYRTAVMLQENFIKAYKNADGTWRFAT